MGSKRLSGRFRKLRVRKPVSPLADMRAVYRQEESEDRGPAQQALRKLFKENLDGYIARLGRLEQAYQAQVRARNAPQPKLPVEEVDPGWEKARQEVQKCLDRFYAKHPELKRPGH